MPPTLAPAPPVHLTDILILGAGLAGLRAAWAAKQAAPGARVLVVSLRAGPSGSSFANVNNALGMQYCLTGEERRDFTAEAVALAPPGRIDPGLATIVAAESAERLRDLQELGLPFVRHPDGSLARHPGCFSASPPRAAVFTGLALAHALFTAKTTALGVEFLHGQRVQAVIPGNAVSPPRAVGALLAGQADGRPSIVIAGAVIAALGGPAPLYQLNQAGPGNPGYGLAILARAGAALANAAYLQFMWAEVHSKAFWPVSRLAEPGVTVMDKRGSYALVPQTLGGAPLEALAAARAGHCPFGYGLPDAQLDLFLAGCLARDHAATVRLPGGETAIVAPMA
ncbi:MAG: FAD-binding protein, partial [Desulfovibrionaceae bacterium]|nr:FAD-binding protein [Desulfovibrionaceae bacterium]